jgi:MFS family permease
MDGNVQPVGSNGGLRSLVRAFAHRNFRLFFAGQSISLIGTWMQQLAMTWLVYRFTNSALLLGLVGFCGQVPVFLLAPIAGVLTDRTNRHRLIVLTQTLAMLQAFLLAGLTFAGLIEVWQIVVLSIFLGIVNTFDMTGRQVFLPEMLDTRADLPNAIALNSSMVNAARLVGPAVAGLLIALVGEGTCFLLNGLSYIPVIAALLAMRLNPPQATRPRTRLLADLQGGLAYAFGSPAIRAILLVLALAGLMAAPFTVLMPVIVSDFLQGDAQTLGIVMAASGLGALTGAIYLAARKTVLGLGTRIALACAGLGLGMIAFTFMPTLPLALAASFATGLCLMVQMTAGNTVLQTIIEDGMRGRVMSLYMMALLGMMPFGSLLGGSLASAIGPLDTVRLGGIACIAAAVWFAIQLPSLRRRVRPLYQQMGILPASTYPVSGPEPVSGRVG